MHSSNKKKSNQQSDKKSEKPVLSLECINNVTQKKSSLSKKKKQRQTDKTIQQTKANTVSNNYLKKTTFDLGSDSKNKTVSPFQVGADYQRDQQRDSQRDSQIQKQFQQKKQLSSLIQGLSSEQLNRQLMSVNSKYAEIYHKISGKMAKSKQMSNTGQKNQRYVQKCAKYIQSNQKLIHQLQQYEIFAKNWRLLEKYAEQNQQQRENTDLIQEYLRISKIVSEKSIQCQDLYKTSIKNLNDKSDKQLNQNSKVKRLEKNYKKMQRKLKNQMDQVSYYEAKCEQYQQKIQFVQKNIYRAQEAKVDLQLQVIHENGKKQRKTRSMLKKKHKKHIQSKANIANNINASDKKR